ncbi:MAG: hypothetical protein HY877_08770 [Deltaproteobacteria bacterium]|nr:hypothetical protein [Deltaproteobacteria bacterium]
MTNAAGTTSSGNADFCPDGTTVRETICGPDNRLHYQEIPCGPGKICLDGACQDIPSNPDGICRFYQCVDTDRADDPGFAGAVIALVPDGHGGEKCQQHNDVCEDEHTLKQYACGPDRRHAISNTTVCPNACSNGVCR